MDYRTFIHYLIFSTHECVATVDYSKYHFLVRNIKQDQQIQISKILSEYLILTIFIRFQKSGVALGM